VRLGASMTSETPSIGASCDWENSSINNGKTGNPVNWKSTGFLSHMKHRSFDVHFHVTTLGKVVLSKSSLSLDVPLPTLTGPSTLRMSGFSFISRWYLGAPSKLTDSIGVSTQETKRDLLVKPTLPSETNTVTSILRTMIVFQRSREESDVRETLSTARKDT